MIAWGFFATAQQRERRRMIGFAIFSQWTFWKAFLMGGQAFQRGSSPVLVTQVGAGAGRARFE
jgi:hypothetical protein